MIFIFFPISWLLFALFSKVKSLLRKPGSNFYRYGPIRYKASDRGRDAHY